MADIEEVIKRLRYVYTSEGADKVTSDMRKVEGAHASIADKSVSAERAVLSLERQFGRLERRYNPLVKAQQDYERVQRQVNAAVMQNPALQARANDVLALAAKRYEAATAANITFSESQGLARYELINLSRQLQDIGVGLASGQSPFMILVQQGPQVADIFTSTTGTLQGFVAQIRAVITPTRVLLGLVGVLGVGAYAGYRSWRNFALALDDTARAAGVSTREMAKLQAAASFRGIAGDDFASAMNAFSTSVFRAERGMGSLAKTLHFYKVNVEGVNETFDAVADLIKEASTDQERLQLLQQAGLPASMDWVRFMQQGADGIRRAKDHAVEFGGAANDDMIRKAREFDEAWNTAWTNFKDDARKAVVEIADALFEAGRRIEQFYYKYHPGILEQRKREALRGALPGMGPEGFRFHYDRFPSRPPQKPSGSPTDEERDRLKVEAGLRADQQRIGLLGELATVQERVRLKEVAIAQARLQPGNKITDDDVARMREYARAQALGIIPMQQRANSLRIEADTLGMAVGAAAAYRAEQEKLLEFRLRGIVLTERQAAELRNEAQAIGEATQAAAERRLKADVQRSANFLASIDRQIASRLSQVYGGEWRAHMNSAIADQMRFNDVMRRTAGLLESNLASGLADVAVGAKTFKEVFAETSRVVIRAIEEMAIKMYIMRPLMAGLDSVLGGGGGFGLGSLFGGLFGGGPGTGTGLSLKRLAGLYGDGAAFVSGRVIPFAGGGVIDRPIVFPMARGAGLAGEAGPEAIMPLRRGPDGRLGVVAQNVPAQRSVTVHAPVTVIAPEPAKFIRSRGQVSRAVDQAWHRAQRFN